MDLISRKAAIEAVNIPNGEYHPLDRHGIIIARIEAKRRIMEIPTVPAVPLEPLANVIVENLDPRCDCNYCFNESTDFEDRECCNCPKMSEEQVKEALTKWMEEQDAQTEQTGK